MRPLRILSLVVLLVSATITTPSAQAIASKFDPLALAVATSGTGTARVIVQAPTLLALQQLVAALPLVGGVVGRQLDIINAVVATVPATSLNLLSLNPLVTRISLDRTSSGLLERTASTVGASAVWDRYGYDGSGIGVAVIDSGVTPWHDDLTGQSAPGGQRLAAFVDLVDDRTQPYDDYGHGTHVAGIVAGNGYDSSGARSGVAPNAHLIAIKALNDSGAGRISDLIAALDYVAANKTRYGIRIVNLSVGAGVYESYHTDPLTLAAKKVVERGIVVVAAAGNIGKDALGRTRYGGITAPGNAPWVLTVGASSHMGSSDRADDTMAAFSSRGPSAVDYAAKPDLVAPGVGIESLTDPDSAFYSTRAAYLLDGTVATAYRPYLSLNGTSMAAPVVTGAIALMLQANPALTPNAVKAILQYTSQTYAGYDALTQGTGFLNAAGAIELARYFRSPFGTYPNNSSWSRRIVWANHRLEGGRLLPSANAWSTGVTWGDLRTGLLGLFAVSWGSGWNMPAAPNVVWGVRCGGADCEEEWRISTAGSSALAADESDTIVWSNADDDTIVWSNSDADTIVWSNSYDDTIVWSNSCVDISCTPVIWNPAVH